MRWASSTAAAGIGWNATSTTISAGWLRRIGRLVRADAEQLAPTADWFAPEKKRQTWMVEFNTICDRCEGLVPRGTKVHANVVKLKDKYLGQIDNYSLTIRCPKCGVNEIVFHTDQTSRSYVVYQGGRRAAGGGMELDRVMPEAAAAAAAPASAVDEARDELTAKLERHQKAVMDAEDIDRTVKEQNDRLFFPAHDLLAAIRARHDQQRLDKEVALQRADEDVFTPDERDAMRIECERLRRELRQREGNAHLAKVVLRAPNGLQLPSCSDETVAAHDAMLQTLLEERNRRGGGITTAGDKGGVNCSRFSVTHRSNDDPAGVASRGGCRDHDGRTAAAEHRHCRRGGRTLQQAGQEWQVAGQAVRWLTMQIRSRPLC
jgi:predicted  nucleic acid-binding Zn-ribbon protein